MPNELRLRADGVAGALDAALAAADTVMSSPALADLPAVTSTHHAVLALFVRDATTGRITKRETVWVTAHTAAATTATVLRAQEGTTAQAWSSGDRWVHGPTAKDSNEGAWKLDVDLPLTSLTNWAAGTGTWAAQVDRITQTGVAAAAQRLHYEPRQPLGNCVIQCDMRIDAGTTANTRCGISVGTPTADGAGGALAYWRGSTQVDTIDAERDAAAAIGSKALPTPVAHGTWFTVRTHVVDDIQNLYFNGGLVGRVRFGVGALFVERFALVTYNASASFRNLKLWSPALPA